MKNEGNNKLKKEENTMIISHSTTLEGFDTLFYNFNSDKELSCSTQDGSRKYLTKYAEQDDFAIRIELKGEFEGEHTPYDTDAGKYYGWNEIRVKFSSFKDFSKKICKIIVNQETFDYLNAEDDENYDGEDDKREWFYNNLFVNYYRFIEISKDITAVQQ